MKLLSTIQHTLTPEQVQELTEKGYTEIVSLRETRPSLFAELANTPADTSFWGYHQDALLSHGASLGANAILLPIGSPAWMFSFARAIGARDEKFKNAMIHDGLLHRNDDFVYLFAHSERESVDETQPDGSVIKRSVFRHVKFFEL